MKLVIDIDEKDFGWNGQLNICRCSFERLIQIVSDGTPLHEGRWVQNWCEWQQYLECSNCGYETGLRCDTNFCPHCGARMKGVD